MGSIQPAALLGAWSAAEMFCWGMDECFSSHTWYSFRCWGKRCFGGDSELSRKPDGVLQSRSWSKTVHVYALCLEGISPYSGRVRMCRCLDYSIPPSDQYEPSNWNQCLEEMVCMAQQAQQLPAGEDVSH